MFLRSVPNWEIVATLSDIGKYMQLSPAVSQSENTSFWTGKHLYLCCNIWGILTWYFSCKSDIHFTIVFPCDKKMTSRQVASAVQTPILLPKSKFLCQPPLSHSMGPLVGSTLELNVNSSFFFSGWRIRKQFFLIKPTDPTKKNVRNILTWVKHLSWAHEFEINSTFYTQFQLFVLNFNFLHAISTFCSVWD